MSVSDREIQVARLVSAAREMVAAEKAYPADSASVPAKMAALTRIDRARERLESTLAPFDDEEDDDGD